MIGTTISHYRILEKLGEGGMGVVYKAQDTKLDRIVALKFLPHHLTSSEAEQSRLLQEAKAAAALNHPNVCSVIDIQEADGPAYAGAPAGKQQFIVMEYVDGVTLREKVVRRSESTLPLQMNEAISYAIQIGEALQAAHTKGIIHRDIKSENIMVTSDARIKVMDFGLAKLKGSLKLTRTLSTSGTLAYMAPEQIQGGAVDARSDIFSFGVVLFEMLTGRLPFRGEHETAMMYSILNEEPETIGKYIPDAPSELLHIVNRALEKDQEDRYQSVHDMVIDLRRSKKESSRPSRQVSHHQASGAGAPSPLVSGKRWRTNRFVVRVGIPLTVIVIGAAWLIIQQSARAPFDSIAVLPLANTAADPNIEYLSDGITEQIINTLTRIPGLRVVPRSSVFYYKGKDKSPLDIGRELDVRAVLLGRIIKRGDTLNIQTDLLDVQQESQLWGEQYVRKLTDVAGVQAEIARGISKKLQLRWSDDEGGELSRRSTENDIAYQSYLKGRYYWNKRSDDGMQKSIQHFEQAIENDPAFALAYVGLADAYITLGDWGIVKPRESYPKAKEAATRALQINNSLGEAHTALAYVSYVFDWDFALADKQFKQAIALNPNYATSHQWYAEYLAAMGRHAEALAEIRRAQVLDPLSLIINAVGGLVYNWAGMYDNAVEECRRTLDMDQDFYPAHLYLAWIYGNQGKNDEAFSEYMKTEMLSGATPVR